MSRRLRITKKTPLWLAIIIAVVGIGQQLGWFTSLQDTAPQVKSAVTTNQPGLYSIVRFEDGDTITIDMNGVREKVRFIGVDTPETQDPRKAVQCFGKAASNFTKDVIGTQQVRLEADPLNTNRDRYNRLLRYVYLPDGTLVNAELIRQGYGFAYLNFPFSKQDEFRRLQEEAQQNDRGLWSSCEPTRNDFGGYTSNDAN